MKTIKVLILSLITATMPSAVFAVWSQTNNKTDRLS